MPVFELLEDLDGKFKNHFKKHVQMTEITRYALQLNNTTWLVVTNQKLYLLQKKLLFITTWIEKLQKVKRVTSDGQVFYIHTEKESKQVNVEPAKKSQAVKLAEEIKKII